MPGWTALMHTYLHQFYDDWQDVILIGIGALFLIAGFLVLYPIFWLVPPALRPLLMVILPLTFILLAVVIWSFLPIVSWTFLPYWGIAYPREPTMWLEILKFFGKYRKYLLFGAGANILYFIGLVVYFFGLGDLMNQVSSSYETGIPILLSWMILNGILVMGSCLVNYLSEPS